MEFKTVTSKKSGRKKLKRITFQEMNNFLENMIDTEDSIVNLDYEKRNFFIEIEGKSKVIYQINGTKLIKSINSICPEGYKKYRTSREFLIDYLIGKLNEEKQKFNKTYGVNIDNYDFYDSSYDVVLLREKNNFLTVNKTEYDKIKKLNKKISNK